MIIFIKRYVYIVIRCIYLFTFGLFFAKDRSLILEMAAGFAYRRKSANTIIPKVELSEVIEENCSIQVREPIEVYGNISLRELVVINNLIQTYVPSKIFEIGTFDGRTTLNMAANCSEEVKVYTLDLPFAHRMRRSLHWAYPLHYRWIRIPSGLRYWGKNCERKIIQLYGNSMTFDFSPFFNTIDFIFIDGNHTYEYVLNDSEKAYRLLKDREGIVLWHDYGLWAGVTRVLNELYLKDNRFNGLKHIKGTSLVCLILKKKEKMEE